MQGLEKIFFFQNLCVCYCRVCKIESVGSAGKLPFLSTPNLCVGKILASKMWNEEFGESPLFFSKSVFCNSLVCKIENVRYRSSFSRFSFVFAIAVSVRCNCKIWKISTFFFRSWVFVIAVSVSYVKCRVWKRSNF